MCSMEMLTYVDIFQKKLDSVYIGLPGVTGIADDMIIFGKSKLELTGIYSNSSRLPGRMDWFLIYWNYSSRSKKVHFFGHQWNSHGITLDPKKIDSILKMEFPKDMETMHSFLGLINFLKWYSPRLKELCTPLRSLILKDAHYNITEEH